MQFRRAHQLPQLIQILMHRCIVEVEQKRARRIVECVRCYVIFRQHFGVLGARDGQHVRLLLVHLARPDVDAITVFVGNFDDWRVEVFRIEHQRFGAHFQLAHIHLAIDQFDAVRIIVDI